jgi:F-type H+-transporting ATPase subunit b
MPLLAQDIGEMIGDVSAKIFPNIGSLVVQLLATTVMAFVVVKFFWKPIKANLDTRREYIKKNIDEAGKLNEEAQINLENSNKAIKDANVEARRIKENAETEALLARQKILNKAEEEANNKLKIAEEQIIKEREEAKQEIREEIINVAMMAASKIVEREINKEDNEKLVNDFLDNK